MARRLVVALALSLGLVVAGCGDDATTETSDTATGADTTAADTNLADAVTPPGDVTTDAPPQDVAPQDTGPDVVIPIDDITSIIPECETPAPLARSYEARIRWTTYGVPHIEGATMGDVIFGQAYAQAKDHICTLADQYVRARSERSKYFGPGSNDANVISDLAWKAVGALDKSKCTLGSASADVRQMLSGYAAGYNKYLEDTGVDNLPEMCRGAEWVKPITELDVQTMLFLLVLRASSDALTSIIAAAAPPEPPASTGMQADLAVRPAFRPPAQLPDLRKPLGDLGSNGWGIGADRSDNGRGKLIANPHFPWEGALRLHEAQLTSTDVANPLNVHGAALIGVPGVLIGFTDSIAWTHTVSDSQRFTMYRLLLDPKDPTVYMYDGGKRRMAKRDVKIEVKQADGSVQALERTFYASHYGPMIEGGPLIWSAGVAFTFRDANFDNEVFIDQFLAMNRAKDIASFKKAYSDFNGVPWVNTMYADKEGNAFYVDSTPVPRLSPETLAWFAGAFTGESTDSTAQLATIVYGANGVYLFDGARADHAWTDAPGARSPGVTPFSEAPQLTRKDYIFNANDSAWIANLDAPLEGFSPLYGGERTARSPRTRMNLKMLTETGDDAISGADGKFDFDELKSVRTSNRAFLFEEWQDAFVARCGGGATVMVDGTSVDLAEACAVLAAWDGRLNLDSVGAHLMREAVGYFREDQQFDVASIYATPFDYTDPLGTPGGLIAAPADGDDPVLVAIAKAVMTLEDNGFAIDATFGDVQFTRKGDATISIPGGNGIEGAFNIVLYSTDGTTLLPKMPRADTLHRLTDLTKDGYLVNYGTSFVMAVEFTDDGPRAECLLTYSQSMDPDSPHFKDQTELFGQDSWRKILFTEDELAADPGLVEMTITAGH